MKKIFITLVAALSLSSCLDVEIADRIVNDNYYKTEAQVNYALNGVYHTLYEFAYHKVNWPVNLASYEDCTFVEKSNSQSLMANNVHSSTTATITGLWSELYLGINGANEILERINGVTFEDEAARQRIIAEAHFLRGLFYYDLVRMFGGVNGIPLRLKPTTDINDAYVAQTPRDEVYVQIIADFTAAAAKNEDGTTVLPLRSEKNYVKGRATNGAAHAFLAEIYLTLEQWQEAADHAEIVINSRQYSLVRDYKDLWDVTTEDIAQNEHIFSIPFFNDSDSSFDNALGSNIAQLMGPVGVEVGGANICGNTYGRGSGTFRVQKWFINFFNNDVDRLGFSLPNTTDPNTGAENDPSMNIALDDEYNSTHLANKDYRIETSFRRRYQMKNIESGELTDVKACYPATKGGDLIDNWGYVNKYNDPKGLHNRVNENDMPRLRLADMYLIQAEAYNELGGRYDDACNAIDMVRERARFAGGESRSFPKYVSTSQEDNIGRILSQEEFRWLVFMERGLEFVGEQKRWFDLVRMRYDANTLMYDYIMNTYLPSQPATMIKKAECVLSERKKYFPIPYTEINRNPDIIQNPGY